MRYAFPIQRVTLDVIQHLNGGVRPEPSLLDDGEPATFFIFDPSDEGYNKIVTADEFHNSIIPDGNWDCALMVETIL